MSPTPSLSACITALRASASRCSSTPSISLDELLKQSDIAMYQAKSAGRNMLRFFDPEMQCALAARTDLESALRLAIHDRQFVLHYQPQVDGVVGAEALLRWRCPERGLVSPGEFIPLAEETGLILPIDQWVPEAACSRLKDWAGDPRTRELRLAINVSASQFRQADFVDRVREALARAGAPAAKAETRTDGKPCHRLHQRRHRDSARGLGRESLRRTVIASSGPVCQHILCVISGAARRPVARAGRRE